MTIGHSNSDLGDGLARIELRVSEIREWMIQNMLKLNGEKTELIVFTSTYKEDLYSDLSITIGCTVVDCSPQVREMGIWLANGSKLSCTYCNSGDAARS